MSKRSAKMLVEDTESSFLKSSEEETKKAREQICVMIRHLEDTGEITVPKFSQREK
jgi:flagellar motor switch protein FliG